MKQYYCATCNKNIRIGNYKARLIHNKGSKHRLMLRTHFLEVLENEKIRDKLESINRITNIKELEKPRKFCPPTNFFLPPCKFPKGFFIPPAPKDFKLPIGFDFTDKNNFDCDLQKAIENIKKNSN